MSTDGASPRPSATKSTSQYASPAPSTAITTPRETSVMPNSEDGTPAPGAKATSKKRPAPKSKPKGPPKKPSKKKRKMEAGVEVEDDGDEAGNTRAGSKAPQDEDEESEDDDTIYCICRRPDSGKWMIGCDGCDDWFHGVCVSIAEADGDLVDKYFCPRCNEAGLGTTLWKRRCRLLKCRKAAQVDLRPPSKYCSKEHGIQFFAVKTDAMELPMDILNSVVDQCSTSIEFQQLGNSVPTPAMDDYYDDGVDGELNSIQSQREVVHQRQARLALRTKYVAMVRDRQKRILEEIKSELEGKEKAKADCCGFDSRLSDEDEDFYGWCASEEGVAALASGKIEGRERVCVRKKCLQHVQWRVLAHEDLALEAGLITEGLQKLGLNEAKLKERQKERTLEHVHYDNTVRHATVVAT